MLMGYHNLLTSGNYKTDFVVVLLELLKDVDLKDLYRMTCGRMNLHSSKEL
jgi:hypothetical protein